MRLVKWAVDSDFRPGLLTRTGMEMIVAVFLALVALCAFYSLTNWRAGVYLWLMVAIIQDPIRKITPGTPVYLSITFAPVYLAAFFGMMQSKVRLQNFTRQFRLLDNSYKLLVLSVVSR